MKIFLQELFQNYRHGVAAESSILTNASFTPTVDEDLELKKHKKLLDSKKIFPQVEKFPAK